MDHLRVRWYASAASRSFWKTVRWFSAASEIFTNCCGIVEAPWTAPPEVTSSNGGAGDAAEVDAAVGVEAAVLDRDDRVLHRRRDLVSER